VPSDPCIDEVLSGGAVPFFKRAICVSWSALSLSFKAEQRMSLIVRGSDCHSECLDPLLRGQTDWFGGGWTVRALWGRIVTLCKCLLVKTLQCRMVWVGVSQCLKGGWTNDYYSTENITTWCFRDECTIYLVKRLNFNSALTALTCRNCSPL
jgi:hypothetical protein